MSTFISQRTNNRTDEFGGCFENRMRLPRLIIENIRRKTGGNLPILCRINASDEVEGGQTVQDAAAVAAYLEQECGVDALHVTRAVHLHDEFMWAPGITHGGFNANLVTEIKQAVSVPVIAVGRFTEPQYAELLVKQGRADLIAFGRQSIADPDLPAKARTGNLETLAPCIGCLLGCVPNMFAGRPISCAVNPCVGRESDLTPAEVSKNVVVVGGGPGGLYAAWICALRGHQVTLLEKNPELGGNFRIAAYPTGKGQITEVIRSFIVKCEKAGVDLRCNVEADEALLTSLHPDAIILATGSVNTKPPIPGLKENPNCIDSTGALSLEQLPKSMVVIGAGVIGLELACAYAAFGTKITVVEALDHVLPMLDGDLTKIGVAHMQKMGMEFHLECPVQSIESAPSGAKVVCKNKAGETVSFEAEKVLVAIGRRANTDALDLAAGKLENDRGRIIVNDKMETSVSGVYAIGDCVMGYAQLAHTASAMGEVAAENIMGIPAVYDERTNPTCVYIEPEAASVGLTEEQAKAAGIDYIVGKFPLSANGKSLILNGGEGLVKVLAGKEYGEILGMHIIGPRATDLIAEGALAIAGEMTLDEIIATIHSHPTVTESIRECALDAMGRAIHVPPRKKKK